MKKYLAEFIGTFTLVLFGCGAAVIAGGNIGILGISFAFGFALIAMAYGIGNVSGCHINPAVSLGVFFAGRMNSKDLICYIASQILGAIFASLVLYIIAKDSLLPAGSSVANLGQNFWNDNLLSAIIFEFIATFLFLIVILGSTSSGAPTQLAGLAIGIALVVIHIVGIRITGVSVNPARSFGPAIFVGGKALEQIWLFLIVPSAAGILAGILYKAKIFEGK